MRYDLTVPFARFVVQHQSEISFPFKRYQIQPVWRADRPQKGRYREFYQCDVDVVGSDSLLNEVELIQIVDEVYRRLKLRVRLLINNRKVLAGIAEIIGYPEKLTDITVAIDKMDKIGIDNVNAELREKGLTEEAILKLQPILNLEGDTKEKLQQLRTILQNSPTGLKGIEELTQVFNYLNEMPLQTEIKLDLTLARGLSYYTGAIFEVKALDAEMGSITGGGRYDDLTGIFGLKMFPASAYPLVPTAFRCHDTIGFISGRRQYHDPHTLCQFRREGRMFLPSPATPVTQRRHKRRNLSRSC